MSAHRLWMKSGASGRAVDLHHSAIDDNEDRHRQDRGTDLHDEALQEQSQKRSQFHGF